MTRRNRLVASMLIAASCLAVAAEAARAVTVEDAEQVIEAAGIDPRQYGLVVRPLGSGTLRAGHNGDKPLNPASTMKLITTHASLALLGPDYRWVTSVYTTGAVEGDTMIGNLIIKGGGDPKLVIEDMTELIAKLRAAGLREIRGDLIIDDSLYAAGPERLEAFDGDSSQPYNVRPYAALMNFKATRFVIDPKSRRVTMDPPLADVRIDNQVKVLNGRCRPNSTGFSIDDAVGSETRPLITISGSQVRACGEQHFYAATLSHRQFIHGFFKAAWKNSGGILTGTTRVQPGAAKGAPYYQWISPRTLTDVVRDVNKFSNNVMARMLLLQIAAHNQQSPATLDDARRVLRQWYANQGLPMSSLVLENGSGLSRIERISANDLTAMLVHAAGSIHAAAFEDSLPQVGIDGTMRTRLRRHPVAGNAFIKTGTLRDVRAIAGYVTAASGERYAVALLINGPRAEGAGKAQDALLRWVYRNG
jgi:D-alanyl-D-alanine carboxypeptidase/D-alanyl-D-alanine-endopeptidase (penicillin-binding protein 4)